MKRSKRRVNSGSRVGALVAHRLFLLWEMHRAAGISPGGPEGIEFGGLNNLLSFAPGTTQNTPGKDYGSCSGRQIRSPGPPGLIPAALGISQSRKTRRATQALTREPVFTRRFDLFTEQPPGVCGRSTESVSFRLLGRVRSLHGLYRPDRSPHTLHRSIPHRGCA